jgi:hypothetical protein
MRKLVHAAAAAALLLSATACQNALGDDYGPLTGTWKVTITDFKYWPANPSLECDVATSYQIRQEGSEIEGVSTESTMTCVDSATGATSTYSKHPGVVRGPVENGRVQISDAGGFHCIAEMHPTRLEGVLESYGGRADEPMQTLRSGSCVLEKVSDEGYYGPRA